MSRRWRLLAIAAPALLFTGCGDDATDAGVPPPVAEAIDPYESFSAFQERFEQRYRGGVTQLDATSTSALRVGEVTSDVQESRDPDEPFTATMTVTATFSFTDFGAPIGVFLQDPDSRVNPAESPDQDPAADSGSESEHPLGGGVYSAAVGDPPEGRDPAGADPADPGAGRRDDENPDDETGGEFLTNSQTVTEVFDFGFRDGRWHLKTQQARLDSAMLAIKRALDYP